MPRRKKLNLTLTPEDRIKRAHEQAIYDLAVKLHNRGRKAEGTLDETGLWTPSALEHFDQSPIKHSSRSYTTWHHVYWLIDRAVKGALVPADVEAFVKQEWPKIHERAMVDAVAKNIAVNTEKERLDRKQQREAEREAFEKSAMGKLHARRSQLSNLENSRKKVESKLKALDTRIKKVKRSIAALERSAAK